MNGYCGEVCGWDVDDSFECSWCERTVCYCEGVHDDTPALCNDCACRLDTDADLDAADALYLVRSGALCKIGGAL